jgi:hypothetical protein
MFIMDGTGNKQQTINTRSRNKNHMSNETETSKDETKTRAQIITELAKSIGKRAVEIAKESDAWNNDTTCKLLAFAVDEYYATTDDDNPFDADEFTRVFHPFVNQNAVRNSLAKNSIITVTEKKTTGINLKDLLS